ncbi:oxidoreductase [Methanoculleus taiwanensis]|uniref:Oxidoreductase n=2 Tax=Methanoculleus taiwanensis TaxID=1550565 RepID=A0A498H4B7_9EURY|nr:oxidoreductase [Methanoculleus taiwanensis]
MHPPAQQDCTNPLWPCAMTGAVACLAGFENLAVIVHGSSGCYFYPASLVGAPIYGTFLVENEIIFGTEERLAEVIDEVADRYEHIAVVTTCVPAILGEDLAGVADEHDLLLVDSPGFLGTLEAGYHAALERIRPTVDEGRQGINIDGVSLIDPLHRGNMLEARRLLTMAGAEIGTTFCCDRFEAAYRAAPFTIGTNPDLASGVGEWYGSLLGLDAVAETFERLTDACESLDPAPVYREIASAEERIAKACDKYLRRFEPPRVAVCGGGAYAVFVAETLERHLDADIACICSRNHTPPSRFRVEETVDFIRIADRLRACEPDLVIGSSYERSVLPNIPFVPLTPPVRGRVHLRARALAGVEGTLELLDEVLNACMDGKQRRI